MLVVMPIIKFMPSFRFLFETNDYQGKVSFEFWFRQKVLNLGGNRAAYWPVHWKSKVYSPERIKVGVDACIGSMPGCYITGVGGLEVGDYTQVGPNVVIVTANHDPYDSRKPVFAQVTIGKYCWIAAGVKIMPGVVLGDWTVVGAGAVVTKSFPEGHCIIGGVPAKKIKDLDRSKCLPFEVKHKYHGYISEHTFNKRFGNKN